MLAESPSILKAQDTVVADKDGLNMVSYVTSANYSSADILNIDENSLAERGEQLGPERAQHVCHHSNPGIETGQPAAGPGHGPGRISRQTQVGYSVGNNDSLDLATAQSTLATAQQNLLDNNCQHQLDVMLFETPWAELGRFRQFRVLILPASSL